MINRKILYKFIFVLIIQYIISFCIPSNTVNADDLLEAPVNLDDFKVEDCSKIFQGPPVIDGIAAIVIDAKTGRVLFEKDAYSKRPMASTTKIMTAILAIELGNLDDEITVGESVNKVWGSIINLRQGEKLTLEDLLFGLMLSSGNDAAIVIAEHIGKTVEGFLDLMNEKAKLLGARNTHFMSPHGLDTEGHYSTPFDLAIITRYALNNPEFSKIVSTKQATIPNRNLYNTNEMLEIYPGADGVKTGYTNKAGRCLVTSATRDEKRLISVVLNCENRYKRAESSRKILDYAFDNYLEYVLLKPGEILGYTPVVKGIDTCVPVGTIDRIIYPLKEEEFEKVKKEIYYYEYFNAPVFAGMDGGYIRFVLEGEVLAESKLKIWNSVEKGDFKFYFNKMVRCYLKNFTG
jgi:D-alanyl-D-alanine carboxypeptidase (penicillin-binding protein 5/6)